MSSQNPTLESKLSEVYSTEICSQILQNSAQKKYFEVLLFQSVVVVVVKEKAEASKSYEILNSIPYSGPNGETTKLTIEEFITLLETNQFNAIKLQIERNFENNSHFRLGKTDKVMTLLSHSQINKIAQQ
jgi:hypothetical protein